MTLELILQDANDDGYDKGLFEAELANLKRLIKKMNMTVEEAMDFSDIPEKEKPKYVSALEKGNN